MTFPAFARVTCLISVGCVALTATNAVLAEDSAAALKCRDLAADAARLACYDAVFRAAPAAAPATPARAPAAPAAAARTFGDTGHLAVETKAKEPLPKTLIARVRKSVELPRGLYRLTLDNDQVWETHEAYWTVQFKADDAIQITRMPLGAYQISLAGQARSLSVRRVN